MPADVACAIRALHQVSGLRVADIVRMPQFRGYARSTIYRQANIPLGVPVEDRRRRNRGRPRKLTARDMRRVQRQLQRLRQTEGNFTSRRLQLRSGLEMTVCNRTFRRYLKEAGYR